MSHISLVTLGVEDLATATAFYEALGWQRSPASVDGTVAFLHGTPVLALFGRDDLAADAGLQPFPEGSSGAVALAMNVESAAAVDELFARAQAAGARISRRPEATDWGGYSGYFVDLDGHLWEVAHNPGFPLRPDGSIELPR